MTQPKKCPKGKKQSKVMLAVVAQRDQAHARAAELERERDHLKQELIVARRRAEDAERRATQQDHRVELLQGVTKELIGNTQGGTELARYGMHHIATPMMRVMPDGYWTPWHMAQHRVTELEDAVVELLGLLDDVVSSDYKPDSFTGQPLLRVLLGKARAKYEAAKAAKDNEEE